MMHGLNPTSLATAASSYLPDVEGGLSERSKLLPKSMREKDPPVIAYDPEQLTNWRAIVALSGTIFLQPAVMTIILSQFLCAIFIAGLLYFFAHHPEAYKTDAMKDVVKTIAVSIAFLLGLFLSSCINRWWDTVTSLEMLFGTIKRLTMTAINLELPRESRTILARRCVLSTHLLQVEQTENHALLAGKQSKEELVEHWEQIFQFWEAEGMCSKYERKLLKKVPQQQRSFFAWSLVSKELLKQRPALVSADGSTDVMAYDRLCDLVQAGVSSISAVRTAAAFQMPYIYVHLLAFMIHLVNVLTAVSTGVRIGLTLSLAKKTGTTVDSNELVTAVVFLVVQAFIYQAFLTIGAALSFPITGSAYRVPLKAMCSTLDSQLKLMNHLADTFHKEEDAELSEDENPQKDDGEDFGV
jgi:predicted membrane chloride channel (bestrophin family)